MAEALRKNLISRLQTSEKSLPRERTPILGRLVPKLNLVHDKSSSTFRKEKLEPLSPFLTKRLESTNDRMPGESAGDSLNAFNNVNGITAQSKSITPLRSKLRLQPLHHHGDTKFWSEDSEDLLSFIKKIKENREFQDDFWYFNKGDHAYDLVLTNFSQKSQNEYCTLSYRGISHFLNGEVQFISLEDWERENFLFKKIQKIKFFSKYRVWKTFAIWMKQRRLNMMEQRKVYLKRNLASLHPDYQSIFLQIRQKCFIVSKLDMLDLQTDQTRTLEQFRIDSKAKARNKKKDLASLYDGIYLTLRSLCSSTTDKFIHSNITGSILDKEENIGSKVLPYTHEAVMRNHMQLLGKFIKLVDYVVLEAKIFLCVQFYAKVLQFLRVSMRELNKSSRAVFVVFSVFDGKEMRVLPYVQEFVKVAWRGIKRCTKYVFASKFFSDCTEFAIYIKALNEFSSDIVLEAMKPEQILLKSGDIHNNRVKIDKLIESYHKEMQDFIASWQPNIKIYQSNISMKVEKFRKMDIQSIFHSIEKLKRQMRDLQKLPDNSFIGIFKVDLEAIKGKLLPSPSECLSKIQSYLPELAMSKSKLLLSDLVSINLKLFQVPSNIHEYISISEDIKEIEEKSEKIALLVMDLKDFIDLMEKNYISVPLDLKDKSAEISKIYEKMRNRMNYLYMRYETDKAKFIKMLRNETKNIEPRLESIVKQLDNPIFVYKDSVPGKMVELLKPISTSLEQLHKESEDFIRYQDILGIPRNNFEAVGKIRLNFSILYSLWKAMASCDLKCKVWSEVLLENLDLIEINEDLNRFHKVAIKSKVLESQGNLLPDLFNEKIQRFLKLIQVTENLFCPDLKGRHWKYLETVVGFDLQNSVKTMTLSQALSKKLHHYVNEVELISTKAVNEELVEKKFRTLIEPWTSAEFSLKYDKEKEFHLLQEPENLLNMIEASLIEMKEIVDDEFVGSILEEVQEWDLKLQLFDQNFKLWLKCQNLWIELEKTINFNEVSRSMIEKIKKFHHGLKEFTKLVFKSSGVFNICAIDGLTSKLHSWIGILNSIEKELEDDDIKRKQSVYYV